MNMCDQVSGVPSQLDTGAGLAPVGSSVTVEPGTRARWPVGLSPAERSSGSLRIWGSCGLMRRRQSRPGLLTPGIRPSVCNASESTSGLVHCACFARAIDPVRNGSLVTSAGARLGPRH